MRPDWQQRVIDEKAQLDERLGKLNTFIEADEKKPLDDRLLPVDRNLLITQRHHMRQYSVILERRISNFE